MIRKQTGFTLVETLLAILIIGVFSFGGYYVWHTQNKSRTTSSNAVTTSAPKSTQQSYPSLDLATSQLQAVYTKWVTQHTDTSEDSSTFIQNSGYFTADFSSNAQANFDPLTCHGGGSSIPPDSYTLGAPALSGGTVTATVNNTFQGNSYSSLVVTMKPQNNTWLISYTDCK